MERKPKHKNTLFAVVTAAGILGLGASCEPNQPPSPKLDTTEIESIIDRDRDGIANYIDLSPDARDAPDYDGDWVLNADDADPYDPDIPYNTTDPDNDGLINGIDVEPSTYNGEDVDNDGIKNAEDQTPYYSTPIGGTEDSSTPSIDISRNVPCQVGLKPDSDGDRIPDYCDPGYDLFNKDSDGDGLPDRWDPSSSSDTDNDGTPDLYDPRPNDSQVTEDQRQRDKEQEQRLEDQLQQDKDQEQRLEHERQRQHQ
jgi:hypothetical protein